MKLNEAVSFSKLNINKSITTPLDLQGFSQYKAPLVGIEVEVENVAQIGNLRPAHSWRVENDGSLRNGGIEYISHPTEPKDVESIITYLYDDIIPKEAHFSPRTSVHVHMNCRNLTFKQIYNIVLTYQCFEDLLYDFAGSERKKSIFCVPVGNTNYYLHLKEHLDQADCPPWHKYTGLNLGPLREYGTIEFRHLRGTRNKQTIYTWLHYLYTMYNFAINIDTAELEKLIKDVSFNHNFFDLGYKVFGNRFLELVRNSVYQKKMREDLAISKLFMAETQLKGWQ